MKLLPTDAPPGRVLTYLQNPEKGTLPASCTLKVIGDNLYEDLRFFSRILRDSAGGKAILNNWRDREPIKVNWSFYLPENHPDFHRMTDNQQSHYATPYQNNWDVAITVNDSMEESSETTYSIEKSWEEFINLALQGKSILVDLSNLRPAGTLNDKGLRATGPLGLEGLENEGSFLAIYEAIANHLQNGTITSFIDLLGQLNQTIRRGGQFKDGIITSSIPWNHSSAIAYLKHPLHLIPGSHKKGIQFIDGDPELPPQEMLELITVKHNQESLFLEKMDSKDPDYYWNVCVGIRIPDKGTCLLYRANLAQCQTPDDIAGAMVNAMTHLLQLHTTWRSEVGNERSGHYAPLEQDCQVALDIMGLASALAYWGVTYRELANAMEAFINNQPVGNGVVGRIVYGLAKGYRETTILADEYMADLNLPRLKYLHSIEPQQKSAESYQDLNGYACSRNIDPPFHHRQWRVSEARGRKLIRYNPTVELAKDMGAELHLRMCELWQQFMTLCGRPHGISYDNWKVVTADDVRDFLVRSPLKTWYYNYATKIDQSYLDKGQVVDACSDQGCVVCAE